MSESVLRGAGSETVWMMSLPLKHREIQDQKPEVILQDRQILFAYLKEKLTVTEQTCELNAFDIPEFKTGTLDYLVCVSDQLSKSDTQLELQHNRFIGTIRQVLEEESENVLQSLTVSDKAPTTYIKSFTWNRMKYRIDVPISEILDAIMEEAHQVDLAVKNKLSSYTHAKNAINAISRKKQGSLLSRDLSGIIKAEDLVQGSDYLETLLFIVHHNDRQNWLDTYEQLTPMGAVPRSSKLLCQDDAYDLFSVTVIKKNRDDFIQAAQGQKFIPRVDFTFNPESSTQEHDQSAKTEGEYKSHRASLIRTLKANFGEILACFMHVKVIRLHVESVLRYGLPPTFLAMTLKPTKADSRIRKILLHALEKLELPGISQLEVTSAQIQLGFRKATDDDDARNAAEEAELWSALGEIGGRDADPFVNLIFSYSSILS